VNPDDRSTPKLICNPPAKLLLPALSAPGCMARRGGARTKRRAYQDWDYWGKPVPGYGDPQARVLVVGLAPAAHGANRTGRVFTGDGSGDFLFPALYRAGLRQPAGFDAPGGWACRSKIYMFVSICRCAPPANKPLPEEIENCRPHMLAEMEQLKDIQGIVAWENRLRQRAGCLPPAGSFHPAPGIWS
jgi:uracil-DNA glycosylase